MIVKIFKMIVMSKRGISLKKNFSLVSRIPDKNERKQTT